MTDAWSEAAVDLVSQARQEGLSAGMIVKKLRSELGIVKTRSAVIGKMHRKKMDAPAAASRPGQRSNGTILVLPPKRTGARPKVQAENGKVRTAPILPPVVSNVTETSGVGPMDLEDHHCRFVIGYFMGEPRYCGAGCDRGAKGRYRPWCAGHGPALVEATRPIKVEPGHFSHG